MKESVASHTPPDPPESGGHNRRRPPGRLPLQSLLLAGIVIASLGGAALALNARTGLPFGRLVTRQENASPLWSGFPLWLPLAWAAALLGARGVAQLWLWSRRQSPRHGYWLLAAAAGLAVLPQAALDLFATRRMHWWTWESSAPIWEGTAPWNLVGLFLVNLIALLCAAPALVNKHPHPRSPGLRTLGVWSGLTLALLAGCAGRASDAALAVLAAPVVIVTVLAFRNARSIHAGDPPAPERRE